MALPYVLRNFAVHVDGTPLFGQGEKCTIPALKLKVEEYRGGGMDIPVELDLGMEKLEAKFSTVSINPLLFAKFGLAPGNKVPLTIRGHLVGEDGVKTPVIVNMRAIFKDLEHVEWETAKKTGQEITAAIHYLKITHGERVVIEIDPDNGIRAINGVNQLAEMRVNLGY